MVGARPCRSGARRARHAGMNVLQLGIPKGSLEAATIELFRRSGWKIRPARSYFPEHGRSGAALPAGARAGDGPLRRERHARRRHHRARLGPGVRRARRGGAGAGLLEDQPPADPLGPRRRPATRPCRSRKTCAVPRRHRAGRLHAALVRRAGHRRPHRVLLGRHRGQGRRGPGRRHRRGHRDRLHHPRARPPHRLRPLRVGAPAHRQPRRLGGRWKREKIEQIGLLLAGALGPRHRSGSR